MIVRMIAEEVMREQIRLHTQVPCSAYRCDVVIF